MASQTKEVAIEFLPLLRVYTDGTVDRLIGSPFVPPVTDDTATGVSSKDVSTSPDVSARLYLPRLTDHTKKVPIFVYFHGGGFCVESAFSSFHHRYMNLLVSQARVLAISVEFRLAPEHPLPTAYEDSWTALQWVCSHSTGEEDSRKDPWLINHGNFNRVFIGGDTSGANIAHNIAMRAGVEPLYGGLKLLGAIISQPFFWGSKPVRSEQSTGHHQNMMDRVWKFVYPSAPGGIDNPMVNPFVPGAPSLSGLACSRLLVCVAEKDAARERGIHYFDAVRESEWEGEAELYEAEGGKHGFHITDPETELAKKMMTRLISFLQ